MNFRTYSLLMAVGAAAAVSRQTVPAAEDNSLAETKSWYGSCKCRQPSLKHLSCALYNHDDRLCDIEGKCEDIQECVDELKEEPDTTICRIVAWNMRNCDSGGADCPIFDQALELPCCSTLAEVEGAINDTLPDDRPIYDGEFKYCNDGDTPTGNAPTPYCLGSQLITLKSIQSTFGLAPD